MDDNLSPIYSDIEQIMVSVYKDIQLNPDDEKNINLLEGLGVVATKVIRSQKNLVEIYESADFKDIILSNLEEKEIALKNALSQTNN